MTVTAGVVGLGFGEKVHVPGLRRAGAEVVAVCARHGAAEAAQRLGVPAAHPDWRALVADDGIRLVSIASPPATHHEIALAALAARKAVLCEKPLAVTAEEAEELAAAARVAGVPTLVDFEFRTVPAFGRAHELLGELGRVREAEVTWTLASRKGLLPPSWKDDRALGGGTLLSLGVHSFDYLEWYLGPVARVRGRLEHAAGPGSDTGCEAELELASGASARVTLSAAAADPQGHVVTLRGERGTLVLENRDLTDYMRAFRLELAGPRPATFEPEPTGEDGRLAPFAALARRIVDAVRTGGTAVPSFEEGLRAQVIAAAVDESHRTGAWVSVGPDPQV